MEEGVLETEKLKLMNPKEVAEQTKEEKGGKGGILNNLISNFIDATTTADSKSGENIHEAQKEKEGSGSGILEKILSHLPEDAVPTADEAAILIHSAID